MKEGMQKETTSLRLRVLGTEDPRTYASKSAIWRVYTTVKIGDARVEEPETTMRR
jgi:hypothetical protein